METDVSIPGGPDGSQTTENPQAVDRETGEEEDESSQGLPQRTTQALKRLTYGSPGKPMYVREMNDNMNDNYLLTFYKIKTIK